MNQDFQHAVRPPGVSGDVGDLAGTARRVGAVYRDMLGWKEGIRSATLPPSHRELQSVLHEGLDLAIGIVPAVARDIVDAIRATAARRAAGLPPERIRLPISVQLPPGWAERTADAYATAQAAGLRTASNVRRRQRLQIRNVNDRRATSNA